MCLANNKIISGAGTGSVIWVDKDLNETTTIKNVFSVPELSENLTSVKKITQAGYKVEFSGIICNVKTKDSMHIIVRGRIHPEGSLYQLDRDITFNSEYVSIAKSESNLTLWHRRLGHINKETMISMQSKGVRKNLPCVAALFADLHWQLRCRHGFGTVLFYLIFNLLIN